MLYIAGVFFYLHPLSSESDVFSESLRLRSESETYKSCTSDFLALSSLM